MWRRVARSGLAALVLGGGVALTAQDGESFKKSGGRSDWPHHIDLYDAEGRKIDPADPGARPYSPAQTCKKCHDLKAVQHGFHFDATLDGGDAGRPGEPWFLVDARSATQLPLSPRDRPGVFRPDAVGMTPEQFAGQFGRHFPGGLSGVAGGAEGEGRRVVTGELAIDCMACHDAGRRWSHEVWAEQVAAQNFEWAPAAALGMVAVAGSALRLPDDLDPTTDEGRAKLPTITWADGVFGVDGKARFDVVRTPSDQSCLKCHSVLPVGDGSDGDGALPRWLHDDDVHTRAGIRCADCHRNGLDHETVRGYEGEQHPAGAAVATLSCRGCHLDETDGHGRIVERHGRLGAPRPAHRGLPPIHLEKLSCTACHSGPRPTATPPRVQTSRAHALGLASQTRTDAEPPRIVEPVLRRDVDGVIRPFRAMWPTYWGRQDAASGAVVPLAPEEVGKVVRRTFRVRKDLAEEIAGLETAELRGKVAATLAALGEEGGEPVLVTSGKVWARGTAEGELIAQDDDAVAGARYWPLGHDVRPARDSLGVAGCTECHAADAPFVYSRVAAAGLLPLAEGEGVLVAREAMGLDPDLVVAWEQSFTARDAFKYVSLAAVLLVLAVLLLQVFVGLGAVVALFRGRPSSADEGSGGGGAA